ncbi:hypothetical protein QR680_003477 [Steinernema hermaphroditum]|uniref:Protein kinase domain-containing protein n=1 Tax=Steinernema hermaphroditum TaxID=289476 RepID=A0AA39H700_9BILA|nr:hypothetical protein QR680_003477 [Steinernema hermaphroditum]
MTTSRLNRYAVIEELGEGTFGKVFKARSKEDGRFVAIKVYKDLIGVAQFHNELEILKGVKNMTQYVVQYIDHFDDDIKHYLVLELAESSLFRELRKLEYINGLPESTLQQLVLQLGCALYFLAGKNIVHRDLKPGNILVWKTSSERYLFKLCDFGNSRVAAAEMDSIAGTVPYAESKHSMYPETHYIVMLTWIVFLASGYPVPSRVDWYMESQHMLLIYLILVDIPKCAINNVLVVERTQNKAYLTLSLLDEHMFSATDSNASFYMINELYNRLKSAHLEEEKLDVILSKNVRGKLSNMHKDLSVQIYERGREVICGDDSLRTVILRHNKMCEEYSTYLDMISCVKGIEMLVNDNAESKTTTKLEAAPSIVRLNEISHQSKRLLNKANGLLELIADET